MATESAVNDTNIYEQLENYPWDSDKEFQVCITAFYYSYRANMHQPRLILYVDIAPRCQHLSL